jgi:hypothetical protein
MPKFEVTMTFKKGPALTVKVGECVNETQALRIGRAEATIGGFGIPKKVLVKTYE